MDKKWSFLDRLDEELGNQAHALPRGIATIVGDGVIAAIASEGRAGLERAQQALEKFTLARLKKSPASVIRAARGQDGGATAEAAALAIGQAQMAHAIVARAASKRADDEFERRLRSPQLERYVRVLLDNELTGRDIAVALEIEEATVCRRLQLLRKMGAVECRKEGNRVVNYLTPAAAGVARACNMGSIRSSSVAPLKPAVADEIDRQRRDLPDYMQRPVVLIAMPAMRR